MSPPTQIKKDSQDVATSTSRDSGAVGKNPVVYRELMNLLDRNVGALWGKPILDFGAGKNAVHTQHLRKTWGFDVTAYDLPANQKPGLHDPNALQRQYPIVCASNVLNTIPDPEDVRFAFNQIANAVESDGYVILNYPAEPRKSSMTNEEFYKMVLERFFLLGSRGPTKGKGSLLLVGIKD
jgi:hypothetical protein